MNTWACRAAQPAPAAPDVIYETPGAGIARGADRL
jgi:hypothetical protein